MARLVDDLTDVSRPGDGNRAARKSIDRAHLAAASARVKTIKLADLTDNALAHSQVIVAHHWHQIAGLSRRRDDWMLENAGAGRRRGAMMRTPCRRCSGQAAWLGAGAA